MILTHTIGVSSPLAIHPFSPVIAYSIGSVLVLFNYVTLTQETFLIPPYQQSKHANSYVRYISCLAFSSDGSFIAVGESGYQPRILVWDLLLKSLVSTLTGHRFGILSVQFDCTINLIISLGTQHDGNIFLWNWKSQSKLAAAKTRAKVN
jgi:WD40 repeat protein